MDLYAQHILDHFRHPRGKQRIANAVISHEENNPSCGDTVTVDLAVKGDAVTLGWDGSGCAISQAAMSMLAEDFSGKSWAELEALKPQDVLDMLGVPVGPRRMKCALLSLHTIQNALRLHGKKPLQGWAEMLESAEKRG